MHGTMEYNLDNAEHFSISIPSEISYYHNEELMDFKWLKDIENEFKSQKGIPYLKTIAPFRRKRATDGAFEDEKENLFLSIPKGKPEGRSIKTASTGSSEVSNNFSTLIKKEIIDKPEQVTRSHVQNIAICDSTSSDVEMKGKRATGVKVTNNSTSVETEMNTLQPKLIDEYILQNLNNVFSMTSPPLVTGPFTPNLVKRRIEEFERLISSIASDGGKSKQNDIGLCQKNPSKKFNSINISSHAVKKIEEKIEFPIITCKSKHLHEGVLASLAIQQGNLKEHFTAVSEVNKQCDKNSSENKVFDSGTVVANEKSCKEVKKHLKEDAKGDGECKAEHENEIKKSKFAKKNKTVLVNHPKKQEMKYKEAELVKKIGTENRKDEIMKKRTEADKRKYEEKMAKVKQKRAEIAKECTIAPKLRNSKAGKKKAVQSEVEIKSVFILSPKNTSKQLKTIHTTYNSTKSNE